MPSSQPETARSLSLSTLKRRKLTRFRYAPDAEAVQQICADLDLLAARKLRLDGTLEPEGREDWRLNGALGATAVQPCSVTLEPVTTRVDTQVIRRFVQTLPEDTGSETDEDGIPMMEDDTLEQLGDAIDLHAVLTEALAIALPDYPRADDADLGEAVFTEPGQSAMTDADARPFAGLAALKDKLTPKE